MMLAPSRIYYSQDSISNKFGKSTEHAGVLIGETLDKLLTGECSIHDIDPIRVVRRSGVYVTEDNRRLWIFKELEERGKCIKVPVRKVDDISSFKPFIRSTIRVRGDPGGICRRISIESSSSSTSDSSDSDDKPLVRGIDRISLNIAKTRKLRPSKIFFSKAQIRCDPLTLERDIQKICTGKYSFRDVRIEVYEFEDKYCAIDNEMLWKLRVAEKFQQCSSVKFKTVSMPECTSNPYYWDELHLDSEMRRVFFKFRKTIGELPTLQTLKVDPSKILYSVSAIKDEYEGKSIVSALVKFRKDPETLKVVRNGEKFYCLENSKLWFCKQVSKIERKLNKIPVKVKMDMDTSMLKYFTVNNSLTVQIKRSHSFSDLKEAFLDFLQVDDDHK